MKNNPEEKWQKYDTKVKNSVIYFKVDFVKINNIKRK